MKPGLRRRHHLQVHRAAAHDRHLRLDDRDRERRLMGDGDGQRFDRPRPERHVVLTEHQLGGRAEFAGNLLRAVGRTTDDIRQLGTNRGPGIGVEKNRDDRVSGRHLIRLDGDSRGQVVCAQGDRAPEILAPGLDQNRLAIPFGHRQSHHAGPAPERFVGRAQLEPRRHRADLDAIRVFGPPFLQVVGYGEHEITVARRADIECSCRARRYRHSRRPGPRSWRRAQ